jgi:sugar phosphate permease
MQGGKDITDSSHLERAVRSSTDATGGDTIRAIPAAENGNAKGRDKAAQFLKQAGHDVIVTPEDDKRVLRRIDLHLLPVILFVYCLQSLDKTTLSYASVFGLIEDTNLKGQEFSWLGSVVYVAQLVFQPLVAYSLVRFPVGKFITVMVFCWGAVLCGMTAAHSFGGLMASRLLLGAFEASVGKFTAMCRSKNGNKTDKLL